MNVPFVKYGQAYRNIKGPIDAAIRRCLRKGDLICRKDLEEFEVRFPAMVTGQKYGVGTNSGTDALFLVLKALGIGPGDEVITVSHTFIATIAVIVACGATPVLVDVEFESEVTKPSLIYKALTRKTKAVIVVHLNGLMVNGLKQLTKTLAIKGIHVIEDSAQAIGAKDESGEKAGSVGIAGCFSFYPSKILGCYGDGGMITTDSDLLAQKVLILRDHCYGPKSKEVSRDVIHMFGFNSRLDNIQAAVLNVKLNYLKEYQDRRKEIANAYQCSFAPLKDKLGDRFCTPPFDVLNVLDFLPSHVYQNYTIKTDKRDALEKYLTSKGVETQVKWRVPNHKQIHLDYDRWFELPETDRISRTVLSLPCYPELTDKEIEYVAQTVIRFFA